MENQLPKRLQKHVVICPHCGKQALDHMTECPSCHERLVPKGYSPMIEEKTLKKIRLVVGIVLSVMALAIIIIKLTTRN